MASSGLSKKLAGATSTMWTVLQVVAILFATGFGVGAFIGAIGLGFNLAVGLL